MWSIDREEGPRNIPNEIVGVIYAYDGEGRWHIAKKLIPAKVQVLEPPKTRLGPFLRLRQALDFFYVYMWGGIILLAPPAKLRHWPCRRIPHAIRIGCGGLLGNQGGRVRGLLQNKGRLEKSCHEDKEHGQGNHWIA